MAPDTHPVICPGVSRLLSGPVQFRKPYMSLYVNYSHDASFGMELCILSITPSFLIRSSSNDLCFVASDTLHLTVIKYIYQVSRKN